MIPYGKHNINQGDIEAVIDVLKSDFLTQGPTVPKFETEIAEYCHSNQAVAVNSATSALHLSCIALGLSQNDIVWTSPITFVASANCALYCGASVDFVDINPRTYNIDVHALTLKLQKARKENKLPKILIPVHLCGQSCEMQKIYSLCQKYGIFIIEDASHAIGGRYQNNPVGNCRYSDITVFSFHPVKIITSGEGGVAVTQDYQLSKRMRMLRSHGITNDAEDMLPRPDSEVWNYQQIDLGYNYRMTDICAAIGLSQLQRLDAFVAERHSIAHRYDELLADFPVTCPWQHQDSYSSYHLYPIRINSKETSTTQKQIINGLRSKGIAVNLHYIPVYKQPYYQQLNNDFITGYCPEAEQYFQEAISLPIYPGLTPTLQDMVLKALRHFIDLS